MVKNLRSGLRNLAQAVKYWWLLLIAGVAMIVLGVLAFVYPAATYVTFSMLFGIFILSIGILDIAFAVSNRDRIVGWGWFLAIAIIETLFGIFLLFNFQAALISIPIFLGVWLMFRGIGAISSASDLHRMGVKGMGWNIAAGILLIICSFIVLWNPFAVGMPVTVIFLGIGFLLMGIQAIIFSFQMQKIHHYFKDLDKD